ncbi:hypothetical protein EO087_07410 [Dyella sp. M7H15-1]|uniref:hypothetical protein n=1 Tax=Dyella sp. M7H15-1 TaxID=2501295 RepID=UPI0010051216|nr:hypothetical protein [Dyella sp. M7H15-1]QAU23568.1 hypothetical protein EO087_05855 [Dyella sp. M7H15-1]QAU23834.1 hypothetical protein EO087_07410 [Dyella sp. M7H15-1]
MPVELPTPQWDTTPPTLPRPFVWLGLFVAIMLAGVILALLTWPKGEPTDTAWFWMRLLAFPALAWCLLFGLRWLYHEQESARLQAADDVLAADRAKALLFAREPLAVLNASYLCAIGPGEAATQIVDGESKLESRDSFSDGTSVRHTALDVEGFNQEERFQSCFTALIRQLATSLTEIPRRVPLAVYLQLPADAPHEQIFALWQYCWDAAGYRSVETTLLHEEQGIMALDEWLDIRGGPELEKIALFIAVQLHEMPSANSAEAAVALLLGWAPLVERKALPSLALLHRPVEDSKDNVNETISRALLWGNAEAANVEHLWQAGLTHADASSLMQASSDLSLGLSSKQAADGIHDIDAAIGDAGVVAAWLAMALAIEHVSQTHMPQLVASRQNTLRATVVQPVATHQESGLQG